MVTLEDKGWRSYQVKDTYFTVPPRYLLDSVIGNGEYGTVCKASTKDGDQTVEVAIKKIAIPSSGKEQLPELRRVVREVVVLRHFSHNNIISLIDLFSAPTVTTERNTNDIYLVTQLLDVDLTKLLEMHRALEMNYIQYFGYQLVDAMAYVHQCGVVHRDLKPSNIVVNKACDLRVVDFGLARDLDGGDMTEYVVTRYYRAPELLLETRAYSPAIDLWSIGCVLVEMAIGKPLFEGRDIRGQLLSILKVVPKPSEAVLGKIVSVRAREFMQTQPEKEVVKIIDVIRHEREKLGKGVENLEIFCDLVDKMIKFDPEDRMSAEDALKHPFWDASDETDGDGGEAEAEEQEPEDEAETETEAPPTELPSPDRLDPQIESKSVTELTTLLNSVVNSFEDLRKGDQEAAISSKEKNLIIGERSAPEM